MNEYLAERELYWPVSKNLLAEYKDSSQTKKTQCNSLEWRKNGSLHRNGDKPALIYRNGSLEWWKNGQFHRDGDKPAEICADGELLWWKNGLNHRDGDKPAWIGAFSTLKWYKNGLLHRTTGPAVIRQNIRNNDYNRNNNYWINGVEITKEVNAWLKTRNYEVPFTLEQQVEFSMTFS